MAAAIKFERKPRNQTESTEAEKAAHPIWETVAKIAACTDLLNELSGSRKISTAIQYPSNEYGK